MGIKDRKRRERERRQQQIIIAAKRIFSEKGYNKATMEDIAKEAELSPGTIYLYFKNKDELFSSISLRVLQYMNMRLEHALHQEMTPSANNIILALKQVMMDVYAFDATMLINMFHLQSSETLKNLSSHVLEDITTLSRNSLRTTAKILQKGIDQGEIINRHPIALADIFWSLFSGVVLWEESKRLISGDRDFLEKTLDSAFEIFERGIRP